MKSVEFEGYWSDRDKEIWQKTDWKARDYKELPVEMDPLNLVGYFYTKDGKFVKPVSFVKYIRPNPIYSPYYGPVYDKELLDFMKKGHFCYPMYDGRKEGQYDIHDRFETSEIADMLSR